MRGKYIIDRGAGPSPVMKVEVWEDNGHCRQPKGMFPYNSDWWMKQDGSLQRQVRNQYVSGHLEEALEKAGEFYSSLASNRIPESAIIPGRRLD